MFYTQVLMSKRGPLAKIWLAAHWEKKLTKAHVFECNLEITIEKILSPKVKIALRTSGHLLLGVVRIYNRKAKYLLADCNEAFLKMKMTFRPGLVDLPKENFEAAYNTITLPEEFHDFDNQNMNTTEVSEHFTLNQSKPEDITLREDYSNDLLFQAGSFGEESEILRRHSFFDDNILLNSSGPLLEQSSESVIGENVLFCDSRDGFGDEGAAGEMIESPASYREYLTRMAKPGKLPVTYIFSMPNTVTSLKMETLLGLLEQINEQREDNNLLQDDENLFLEDADLNREIFLPPKPLQTTVETEPEIICLLENEEINAITLSNEEEGFTLEPIDISDIAEKKKSKKRKLLIDPVKEISSKTMHKQLNSFTDTLMVLELAPPTERLMMWKKKGGVETLLSTAAQDLTHAELKMLFTKFFLSCDFKFTRSLIQKESVREETGNKTTKETSMTEEPRYQQESSQNEAWKEAIDGSIGGSYEDTSRNNNSEDSVEIICSPAVESNSTPQQETENRRVELELLENEQNIMEERWNRRILYMLNKLREANKMGNEYFSLLHLCKNGDRKQAAAKFYSFLALKKQKAIELSQSAPYEDIIATVGPMFHEM